MDFWVPSTLKVIEFDGDYWYNLGDPEENKLHQESRDELLKDSLPGLNILHIKECDFRLKPLEVIKNCRTYLNE